MQHDFVYEKNVEYLKRWADNFFRLVIRWTIFHFFCTFLNRVKSLKMFRNPLSIFISFGNQLGQLNYFPFLLLFFKQS